CTAYECYARDCFRWILNNIPIYAKRYIGNLSIPVKELGDYDFKLLQNAGNIFNDREGQSFKIFEEGKKIV
ncbi:MAG: hypothetical protein QME59_06955, partial [Candidatus Hydrothermarchaeota archaeon]|nr:hypothetical protein [Candidatus Hydrothermarchaeota archaeon]